MGCLTVQAADGHAEALACRQGKPRLPFEAAVGFVKVGFHKLPVQLGSSKAHSLVRHDSQILKNTQSGTGRAPVPQALNP